MRKIHLPSFPVLTWVVLFLGEMSSPVVGKLNQDGSCPLLTLVPFRNEWFVPSQFATATNMLRFPDELTKHLGFSYVAAVQMAMDQFNARDPSIVPELASLGNCSVYFPEQVVLNTGRKDTTSVRGIYEARALHSSNNNNVTGQEESPHIPSWCAVIGPMADRAVAMSAAVTSAYGIPQLVYGTDDSMATSLENPTTVGTVLTISGKIQAVYSYLTQRPTGSTTKIDCLAILASPFPPMQDFAKEFEDWAATTNDFHVIRHQIARTASDFGGNPKEPVRGQVDELESSGIQTILLALNDPQDLMSIAEILREKNMLGENSSYFYIVLQEAVSFDGIEQVVGYQQPGSPLDKLLDGALVISSTDPFAITRNMDPFLASWKNQGQEFIDRINQLVPVDPRTNLPFFQADPSYFQSRMPAAFSSFLFDSVIAVGLGSCKLGEKPPAEGVDYGQRMLQGTPTPPQQAQEGGQTISVVSTSISGADQPITFSFGSNPPQQPDVAQLLNRTLPPGPASELILAILTSRFSGASGAVDFTNSCSKCRNPSSVTLGAYNIRPLPVNQTTGLRTYTAVLTSYRPSRSDKWVDVKTEQFLYRGGTLKGPATARIIRDNNYLSKRVRIMGLVLFGFAIVTAVTCFVLLIFMHEERSIKTGQPLFLCLLCVGAMLMSLCIFTLSWDEGAKWSHRQLDMACTLTPWLFFAGHMLMFSALFTKMWRIDLVLQFSRKKVHASQVIWPVILVMVLTLGILTAWTSHDPWHWERHIIQEVPAVTYGECTSDSFDAYFCSLAGLIMLGKIVTAGMAWKTADIPQDFSDTSSVFYALSTHIQAWFIGIPILAVLRNDSVNATYFGRVLLIWVFAVSGVALVVCPKIVGAFQSRFYPGRQKRKNRIHVTGLQPPLENSTTARKTSSFRNGQDSSRRLVIGATKDADEGDSFVRNYIVTNSESKSDQRKKTLQSHEEDGGAMSNTFSC